MVRIRSYVSYRHTSYLIYMTGRSGKSHRSFPRTGILDFPPTRYWEQPLFRTKNKHIDHLVEVNHNNTSNACLLSRCASQIARNVPTVPLGQLLVYLFLATTMLFDGMPEFVVPVEKMYVTLYAYETEWELSKPIMNCVRTLGNLDWFFSLVTAQLTRLSCTVSCNPWSTSTLPYQYVLYRMDMRTRLSCYDIRSMKGGLADEKGIISWWNSILHFACDLHANTAAVIPILKNSANETICMFGQNSRIRKSLWMGHSVVVSSESGTVIAVYILGSPQVTTPRVQVWYTVYQVLQTWY